MPAYTETEVSEVLTLDKNYIAEMGDSIKISFKNSTLKKTSSNLVLFADEKFSINSIKKYISSSEFSYISDLLKTSDLSKNLLVFELSSKKKIVLVSIKKNIRNSDV